MSDNGKDSKERMGYYAGSKREGKCTKGAAYGRSGLTSDHYRKAVFEAAGGGKGNLEGPLPDPELK